MRYEGKPIVSITRNEDIIFAVRSCLDQLKIPDLTGKNILLKPNVGREALPNSGINTNPEVVSAIFNYLKERYNAQYYIGDSPIINTDTKKAFEKYGYSELLKDENIHFIDLDDKPPIEKEIPNGKLLKSIKLTGYWKDFDYIISIPVLKMHMHCGASLSFKNLKGLIYKRNKVALHHFQSPEIISHYNKNEKSIKIKELDVAIADFANLVYPDLAIIDASIAHEGMGPSSGNPVRLNTIIASTSSLAADIIALAISQPTWTLDDVPHLKLISESLFPSLKSFKDIKTIPQNIEEFIHPLKPSPESITIKYKNVILTDIDSCSACLSTIFKLLENNIGFISKHFTEKNPLRIAIGKGIKQSDLYSDMFLVGNCTSSLNKYKTGVFIKGCTPTESIIMQLIKENLKVN